ncbi:unnamed protein product [Tenebrio molitor]|nr:unnamed protein product [Tenebrio molitor]
MAVCLSRTVCKLSCLQLIHTYVLLTSFKQLKILSVWKCLYKKVVNKFKMFLSQK